VSEGRLPCNCVGFIAALPSRRWASRSSYARGRMLRFPFGRDLVLDVNPMPFSKRTPVLNVAENGTAKIDLWCNRGTAPVFVAANTITIGDGPMTLRECRLDHRHADDDLLRALTVVTNWRIEDSVLLLV
jgi:heat shock protein HslJ